MHFSFFLTAHLLCLDLTFWRLSAASLLAENNCWCPALSRLVSEGGPAINTVIFGCRQNFYDCEIGFIIFFSSKSMKYLLQFFFLLPS
jgi:hypothetical protein